MKNFIKGFFKLIFKIIALPFIVALTIIVPFMTFVFSMSEGLCAGAAVIIAGGGILLWATGTTGALQGIALIVIGFLVSPLGFHAVVNCFLDLLDDLNCSLKSFVAG